MKLRQGLLCVVLTTLGCYHNNFYPIPPPSDSQMIARLNDAARGRQGQLITTMNDTLPGRDFAIARDSLSWRWKSNARQMQAMSNVSKIVISRRNTGKGLARGLLVGLSIGGGLGLSGILFGQDVDCTGADSFCIDNETAVIGSVAVFGTLFGSIGFLNGVTTMSTDEWASQP